MLNTDTLLDMARIFSIVVTFVLFSIIGVCSIFSESYNSFIHPSYHATGPLCLSHSATSSGSCYRQPDGSAMLATTPF